MIIIEKTLRTRVQVAKHLLEANRPQDSDRVPNLVRVCMGRDARSQYSVPLI